MKKSTVLSDVVIKAQLAPEIPDEIKTNVGYIIETKEIPQRATRTSTLAYPIDKLEAGSNESFLVPASPDRVKQVMTSIRTFGYRHKFNVTLRSEDNGVRVWRAA